MYLINGPANLVLNSPCLESAVAIGGRSASKRAPKAPKAPDFIAGRDMILRSWGNKGGMICQSLLKTLNNKIHKIRAIYKIIEFYGRRFPLVFTLLSIANLVSVTRRGEWVHVKVCCFLEVKKIKETPIPPRLEKKNAGL